MGEDYEIREELLENLRKESYANGRMRSGPVIASGMAVFDPTKDTKFSDVFSRADSQMYENKKLLKSGNSGKGISNATIMEIPVPEERKRKLDGLFGALFTAAGEGYVFLNDLRYDYSRWALSLVDDFGLPSEYMYHAGKLWQQFVHPDDLAQYRKVVDAVVNGKSEMQYLRYRARRPDGAYIWLKPRAFVLNDDQGNPEYFGGIIVPQ
jgi:PAS domain-containing protein